MRGNNNPMYVSIATLMSCEEPITSWGLLASHGPSNRALKIRNLNIASDTDLTIKGKRDNLGVM